MRLLLFQFISLSLLLLTLTPQPSFSQDETTPAPEPGLVLDLWRLGIQPMNSQCVRAGINLDFMLPGLPTFPDPWFLLLFTCNTAGGSVGNVLPSGGAISCQDEHEDPDFGGAVVGFCRFNQGDDLDMDFDTYEIFGKVDAICTAELTSFIPQKKCGPNAHCVPDQGQGHSVGTCQCLDGYLNDGSGYCIEDPAWSGERGTERIPTTPEVPNPGDFQLPALNLLIGLTFGAEVNSGCNSGALLNKTYCKPHQSTVSCLDYSCGCNMREDAIYDDKIGICVGLAGAYCLSRRNLIGWKACVEGADCFLESGSNVNETLYSFGTCECLYGWVEQSDGTCRRDEAIVNPSTKRPGGPRETPPSPSPEPTSPVSSSEGPGGTETAGTEDTNTSPPGGASSSEAPVETTTQGAGGLAPQMKLMTITVTLGAFIWLIYN